MDFFNLWGPIPIQFSEPGSAEFASFDHLNRSHVETGATTMKNEKGGFGLGITDTMWGTVPDTVVFDTPLLL